MYAAIPAFLLVFLALAPLAVTAAKPSFDCTKAEAAAEKAVCANEGLAALDRETARLYKLALTSPQIKPEGAQKLKAVQRGWIKGRDDCWKSAVGLEACVAAAYVLRIHELRQGYAGARSADDAGISLGPFAYACEGLDAGLSVIFVNGEDARFASLMWRDKALALPQGLSASGARYTGANFAGEHEFWIKGQEATFTRPGQPPLACRVDDTG